MFLHMYNVFIVHCEMYKTKNLFAVFCFWMFIQLYYQIAVKMSDVSL